MVPITRQDIIQLHRDVEAAGAFEAAHWLTLAKFAGHLALACVLAFLCARVGGWMCVALTPLVGLSWIIAVMNGHDATHQAVFKSRAANIAFRNIAFPLLTGMSGLYWRYKHNVLHHTNPNVVGYDEDLEMLPLAVGRAYHLSSNRLCQWLQRHVQSPWIFWPMTSLLPWELRIRSIRYLKSHVKARGLNREWMWDVCLMTAHWTVFLIIPMATVGILPTLAFYLAVWSFAGVYLGMVSIAGHTALPLIGSYDDRIALQFYTTRNLDLGPVLSWCFLGLDYQIEHHLFPGVAHVRLKRAAAVVQEFARRHALPYHQDNLSECLKQISQYLRHAWNDPTRSLTHNTLVAESTVPCPATWGRLRPPRLTRPDRISCVESKLA